MGFGVIQVEDVAMVCVEGEYNVETRDVGCGDKGNKRVRFGIIQVEDVTVGCTEIEYGVWENIEHNSQVVDNMIGGY